MNERRRNWITWAAVAVTIVTVGLMLVGTLQKPERIQLPETGTASDPEGIGTGEGDGARVVIAVTPETVQDAIRSLDRPELYCRTVTVEQIWSGGSSAAETAVAVRGGWTRTDRTLSAGRTRHSLTDGETTYIWYDQEKEVYTAAAGEITADMEQGIPTYEDVLLLPATEIAAADHRAISGVNCIYVETKADESGYSMRYWVSVETGLLVAAEKLAEEVAVYRMASLEMDGTSPAEELFTLPDGTVLLE